MSAASQRLRIGTFDCLLVKDGAGSHPQLSDYMDPLPDQLTTYEMFMEGGVMLVDAPEGRVLIDGGNGPTRGPRTHAAEETFAQEGIGPESIDTILLTHGDPDHIMGLLTPTGDPVYPHASYVLHRDLWDAWHAAPSSGLYFPRARRRSSAASPTLSPTATRCSTRNRKCSRESAPCRGSGTAPATPPTC